MCRISFSWRLVRHLGRHRGQTGLRPLCFWKVIPAVSPADATGSSDKTPRWFWVGELWYKSKAAEFADRPIVRVDISFLWHSLNRTCPYCTPQGTALFHRGLRFPWVTRTQFWTQACARFPGPAFNAQPLNTVRSAEAVPLFQLRDLIHSI